MNVDPSQPLEKDLSDYLDVQVFAPVMFGS